MKTSNIQQGRAHAEAIIRGWVSNTRAGSSGITVEAGTTTATNITRILIDGGTIIDNGDGTVVLSVDDIPRIVVDLTNKSGGDLVAGDVVVVDTDTDAAIETTTTAQETRPVGVVQEDIANNATGAVLVAGFAETITLTASGTRGHYIETSTTAKKATTNATRRQGSFGVLLTTGTTPSALLFGVPDAASAAVTGFATPALTYGTPAAGSASTVIRSDATITPPTEAQVTFTDITTNNVSSTKHGYAPKNTGTTTKFLRDDGAYAIPPGVGASDSFWDSIITKAATHTVTNSATFASDSELTFACLTNETWMLQLVLLYVTDATGDIKYRLHASASTFNVALRIFATDNTGNGVVNTAQKDSTVTDTTTIQLGGGSLSIIRVAVIEGLLFAAGNMTVTLQMAQNVQTVGQSAVTQIGSRLALRKLA